MTEITRQITCFPLFTDFLLKRDGLYSPIHLAWLQSSTNNVFHHSWNQCSIQRLGKCNLRRILCGIGQHKWVVVTVVFTWSAWQFPSYFRDFVFFLFAVQNCTARKLLECVVASTKELEWDSILTPCANWFYNEFSGDLSTNRLAEGTFCDLTWFSASLRITLGKKI